MLTQMANPGSILRLKPEYRTNPPEGALSDAMEGRGSEEFCDEKGAKEKEN